MGIYLGQLPPAELARLKAELAETLVTNFCYPRFFDYRTESLRMRPVDRAKRQEVWLYLSAVDFTAWNRVDLMSPDFQRNIERLLILFVQRNRSFFGEQGRKRLSDIRMLINSSAASVVQGLRAHITGQRQVGSLPFGSPRPVVSWSAPSTNEQREPSWEQIATNTLLLQQQLQELRGEIKPITTSEVRPANGSARQAARPPIPASTTGHPEQDGSSARQGSAIVNKPVPQPSSPINKPAAQANPQTTTSAPPADESQNTASLPSTVGREASPAGTVSPPAPAINAAAPAPAAVPTTATPASASSAVVPTPVRQSEPDAPKEPSADPVPVSSAVTTTSEASTLAKVAEPLAPAPSSESIPTNPTAVSTPPAPVSSRSAPTPSPLAVAPSPPAPVPGASIGQRDTGSQRDAAVTRTGEDDIAIFEQMHYQLVVWLRVEAIHAGIEIAGQSPAQLLELLRQQARLDETRLQVTSSLLNLSNQIIKNGQVSLLDYKQALKLHLMHTRR